jgi:hypothetical protein
MKTSNVAINIFFFLPFKHQSKIILDARFGVFMAVKIQVQVFWIVMLHSVVGGV